MEIKYQFFKEEQLLIQKFSGVFSLETHMRYHEFQTENEEFSQVSKVLVDFRDIQFDLSLNIFRQIMNHIINVRKKITKHVAKSNDANIVFWVNKPLTTVIAQQVKRSNPNINYNYCALKENVMRLLDLPPHINLDEITQNLENTY
jgi:hypothetical protein